MLSDCPASMRKQRHNTLRLAKAFRADDRARQVQAETAAELDAAFGQWAADRSTSREEARNLLEMAGMIAKRNA